MGCRSLVAFLLIGSIGHAENVVFENTTEYPVRVWYDRSQTSHDPTGAQVELVERIEAGDDVTIDIPSKATVSYRGLSGFLFSSQQKSIPAERLVCDNERQIHVYIQQKVTYYYGTSWHAYPYRITCVS